MNEPIRVLYIAGLGRSGSTILGRLLGEVPGLTFEGELHRVWLKGILRDGHCGCGRRFSVCEFWARVRQHGGASGGEREGRFVMDWMDANLRIRHFPTLRLGGLDGLRRRPGFERVVRSITGLYGAVRQAARADWVVDASKDPVYGQFLSMLPGFELWILHLVRDPRAVSHSWRSIRRHPLTGEPGLRMSLVKSAALWTTWNALATWIGRPARRTRVRYEDFTRVPEDTLDRVINFVGRPGLEGDFLNGRIARLDESHILSGDFGRFRKGKVEIRASNRWRGGLRSHESALVTALTVPLLAAYRYPLFPGGDPAGR